jgi:hypothetical protein
LAVNINNKKKQIKNGHRNKSQLGGMLIDKKNRCRSLQFSIRNIPVRFLSRKTVWHFSTSLQNQRLYRYKMISRLHEASTSTLTPTDAPDVRPHQLTNFSHHSVSGRQWIWLDLSVKIIEK